MALTGEQRRNIAIANRLSSGHAPRVRLALLEAMGVESSYRNLRYGDRDSLGVLQQRPSQGWRNPTSVKQAVMNFLERADRNNQGFSGSAGKLAQSVQRSAFPDRYDQRQQEARSLLSGSKGLSANLGASPGSAPASIPGASGGAPDGSRQAITAYLLQSSNDLAAGKPVDPNSLLQMVMLRQQMGPGQQATTVTNGNAAIPVIHGKMDGHTKQALKLVEHAIGTPYVWGGAKPGGFDCSGLLQWAWGKSGVRIPRTTYDQWKAGSNIRRGQLKAGDAVFFKGSDSKNGQPGHVGMYIGGGRFIEAPHTGSTVHISHLAGRTDYMGARRF
jgi:cell wall-associated NlpC family hydrolase